MVTEKVVKVTKPPQSVTVWMFKLQKKKKKKQKHHHAFKLSFPFELLLDAAVFDPQSCFHSDSVKPKEVEAECKCES